MANSKKRSSRIIHYISPSQTHKIKDLCVFPAEKWSKDEEEHKQRKHLNIFIKKRSFKWKIKTELENFIPFILEIRRKAFSLTRYKKRIRPSLPTVDDLFSIFLEK